jgi:hypothetical protein
LAAAAEEAEEECNLLLSTVAVLRTTLKGSQRRRAAESHCYSKQVWISCPINLLIAFRERKALFRLRMPRINHIVWTEAGSAINNRVMSTSRRWSTRAKKKEMANSSSSWSKMFRLL